jgi:glycosyltransferase involved in cell wall biosynthesis
MNFLASSPDLGLSGANVLLAGLLSGLVARGHQAQWMVTSHKVNVENAWLNDAELEFQVFPATPVVAVRRRQKLLVEAVCQMAPCVYFPNYDFDMLWAVGVFPENCRVVFIMHCDDPVYYEAIDQRGHIMDAILCVSAYLATEVRRRWPEHAERVHHIPFGVELPEESMIRKVSLEESPLEVVYCGRLAEEQKRIGDLAEIILNCHARNLPVRFHIAGNGPDEDAFFSRLEAPLKNGRLLRLGKLPHDQVAALLGRCHAFILTSAYEGLPVSLLEAMAHACVPVVTAVESGIPEVVDEGINGFMLPIGDTAGFVKRLELICGDEAALEACGRAAKATIGIRGYTLEACLDRYADVCSKLMEPEKAAEKDRGSGTFMTPPRYRWQYRLRARLGW